MLEGVAALRAQGPDEVQIRLYADRFAVLRRAPPRLELLRRPAESSSLVLTARPSDWTLSLTASYVGERQDIDPQSFVRRTNDSFLRLDLGTRWGGWSHLAPYARIENLADREYEEVLGFPAPGRTLIVGLEVGLR